MSEIDFSNDELLDLEKTLKSRLHPVEPSQKFVWSLKRKLEESTTTHRQHRLAVKMLVIAVGLTVGLAVFLIGRGYLLKNGET
jgi:hypothetical protein